MRTEIEHLSDDAIVALLQEHAAQHGAVLAEHVNGHWRAGFVARDRAGDYVMVQPAQGPDRTTALRQLLANVESEK